MPVKLPFSKDAPTKGKPVPKSEKKAPAKPAQGGKPAPAAKKTPTSAPAKAPRPRTTKAAPAPEPPPPLFDISPERKLDLVGIGLALTGFVIALSLLSSSRSAVTGAAVSLFSFLFGWGAYILPLALILFGGWLILRKIEKIPPVSIERVTGLLLLSLWLLVVFQGISENPEPASGIGGGWLGSLFYRLFVTGLGAEGLLVVLIAWLLIGISLAFDLSIPEIVATLQPIWLVLKELWQKIISQFSGNARRRPAQTTLADGFTPLQAVPAVETPPAPGNFAPAPNGQPHVWTLPDVKDVLVPGSAPNQNEEYVEQRARLIEETLASFGAPAQVVEINRGPTVTQFGVEPLFIESRSGKMRVRVSKIVSLSDDLALALAAPRIRIQAPVPGHSYLGIEVPNEEMTVVALRDLLESEAFRRSRKALSFALGQDVSGHPIGADLAAMPHLLIAGTTGSGKSVCVNAILSCLLLNNTPDDLRLVLVDPKRVELTGYNGIPHLLSPVVVEMEKVIGALQWMTREMDRRYHQFAQVGARNIVDYNTRMKTDGQKRLPYLVVVIDELADLMLLAPDETERTITRLAQLARATGIHLILATQRPSVDVVTGLIKANFPARVAFAVASNTDSRVILDQPGAERLLGRGDMLYQAPDAPAPVRLQGVFVSDSEIHRLVEFWSAQGGLAQSIVPGGPVDAVGNNLPLKQIPIWEEMAAEQGDPLYSESVDLVRREGRASVSMLQRKLRIGYTRAARIVDKMEEKGIIGAPEDATGVRKVLDYGPAAPPANN
jgi:S-DNA-T family DNA segregation ATPase FtsK/SpoIIIE